MITMECAAEIDSLLLDYETVMSAMQKDMRLHKLASHITPESHPLSRGAAARLVFLEEHYFSSYFRRITGHSYAEFCRRHRVVAALKRMSLERIAMNVGYRNRRSLERGFRDVLGLTPKVVQRSLLAGQTGSAMNGRAYFLTH